MDTHRKTFKEESSLEASIAAMHTNTTKEDDSSMVTDSACTDSKGSSGNGQPRIRAVTVEDIQNEELTDYLESVEERALGNALISEQIFDKLDFNSLQSCRQVSTLFNSMASAKLYEKHYFILYVNYVGAILEYANIRKDNNYYYSDDEEEHTTNKVKGQQEQKSEAVRESRLKTFLTNHRDKRQFKNLKLKDARSASTVKVSSELIDLFEYDVIHLRIECRLDYDIIPKVTRQFPCLQFLHLKELSILEEDHGYNNSPRPLFNVFRLLKGLHVDKLDVSTCHSISRLGLKTPDVVKTLTIHRKLDVDAQFIEMYFKLMTFGCQWKIRTIQIQLCPPILPLQLLRDFLAMQGQYVHKLCLYLFFNQASPQPEYYDLHPFPSHYFPPSTFPQLRELKLKCGNLVSSFFPPNFISTLNLSHLEHFHVNDGTLNIPRHHLTLQSRDPTNYELGFEGCYKHWKDSGEYLTVLHQIANGLARVDRFTEAHAIVETVYEMQNEEAWMLDAFKIKSHQQWIYSMLFQGDYDEALKSNLTLVQGVQALQAEVEQTNISYSLPPLCPLVVNSWSVFTKERFVEQKDKVEPPSMRQRLHLTKDTRIVAWTELKGLCEGVCVWEDRGEVPLFLRLATIYAKIVRGGDTSNDINKSLDKFLAKGEKIHPEDVLNVFRTIFEIKAQNSNGHWATLGDRCGHGGDTGLPSSSLYYCGQQKRDLCRCGQCSGSRCGPEQGCPCSSCLELVGIRVNRDNVLCQRGGESWETVGDTGLTADNIFYCGRRQNECRCGTCDGYCGPENGCPCNACFDLVAHLIDID